jgi:surface antigen
VRRLRKCVHSPKGDHDGHAQGYLITLIARSPLGLQITRGGLGAAPDWTAGAEAAGHVAAPELPRAGSGSWSRRARGGPGAAPSWAAGAGAAGHVAAPKATSAGM